MKHYSIFLFWLLFVFSPCATFCTTDVNTEDFPEGCITMTAYATQMAPSKHELRVLQKEEKILLRTERTMGKFQKLLHSKMTKKSLEGISDPVDKWFWIWTLSWGFGIILTLLAGGAVAGTAIGVIWLLAFSIGAVALVIWLLKKFG